MPSPRLLKLLAEGLSEAPSGVAKARELSSALLEGLKKAPELAEALSQVLSKLKAKSPGISDALQEAAASFLSGQKTPQMIQEARKARSLAVGEHMMGTGRKLTGMPETEKVTKVPDISEASPFVPTHRPPPTPEQVAGPRSLQRQGQVERMAGGAQAQMSRKEIETFQRKAFAEQGPKADPNFPPVTASESRNILRPARQRLGIQEPQEPLQSLKAEEQVVPPGKLLYRSPKGPGKGSRLSPQEAQARAAETWEQMTPSPRGQAATQLPLPGTAPPLPPKTWRGEPPKGYAQFLPRKGEQMAAIRPGPTRTQAGPGVVPQKSYDVEAPPPKIEASPEDLFSSPEVQRLYRRIILGKE